MLNGIYQKKYMILTSDGCILLDNMVYHSIKTRDIAMQALREPKTGVVHGKDCIACICNYLCNPWNFPLVLDSSQRYAWKSIYYFDKSLLLTLKEEGAGTAVSMAKEKSSLGGGTRLRQPALPEYLYSFRIHLVSLPHGAAHLEALNSALHICPEVLSSRYIIPKLVEFHIKIWIWFRVKCLKTMKQLL